MSFEHLKIATSVVNKDTRYFTLVHEWSSKRESLQVQLADLPNLIAAYKGRSVGPYATNPKITSADEIPRIRLGNACEAATNTLYGMADIAALLGNRVPGGQLPSSFNQLRKRIRKQYVDRELIYTLGDLQWYERVREARTEWAHSSTALIGNDHDDEPVVVIQSWRRISNKEHFAHRVSFRVAEISHWIQNAIMTVDAFGGYLLQHHVLTKFDPDADTTTPKRDENGLPVMLDGNRFATERVTIREYFGRYGIGFDPEP